MKKQNKNVEKQNQKISSEIEYFLVSSFELNIKQKIVNQLRKNSQFFKLPAKFSIENKQAGGVL